MNPNLTPQRWSLALPSPWQVREVEGGFEITQPEGAGVLQIREALKEAGDISPAEALAELKRHCPKDTACAEVRCGDFAGWVADTVDWASSRAWRIWCVASGHLLLHITYTCWRGEEKLEADDASALLRSLRSRL